MATYAELITASQNGTLTDKIRVACVVAAGSIMAEAITTTNHVNRLLWAKQVFNNPEGAQRGMVWAVLAQNKMATLAAIGGATDSQVQAAVDAAVDIFANGS